MVDIKGNFSDAGYSWSEVRPGSGGAGPRSMEIKGAALGTGSEVWLVAPNPHGNNDYNSGGQALLYAGFVKKINAGWPAKTAVTFTNLKSFSDIPAKLKPKGWEKMDQKKQKTALDTYNTDTKAALVLAAETAYKKLVLAHLKTKKASTFTFGGTDFTLG